ncbi:thiamine pyrophosphate-binding protein [Streptomyces sp. NBC_00582]|uniref:thiamine pyrophosphate-binding protein n=1 Tax=Streptomyces sp. NBC_00582 TaxID=2975783 RepID=UPI002E824729|nr:thiamine pyrophosphate-binding protein [Streptomyces sp. NBC_00582]WUB67427.1 thiamine pyrophosphate-binding protein [Streptomyces sp. NBC_00582]
MTRVSGGDIVVRLLQQAGVDRMFGINGAHIDSVYQAALDHRLPIVDTRHEMNAGHAAEGYARVRNALGVALLTAGGGFTNAVTSMANAHLDRTPVLYLAASGPLAGDQTNTLQAGLDQVAIATPVTKWAHRVTRASLIPRILARAIRTALSAPRGPVLVDIPWDVLTGQLDEMPDLTTELLHGADHGPGLAQAGVYQILRLLAESRRPVIVAGSEVPRSGAGGELRAFAERLGVPLMSDYEGLGAISRSPMNFGLVQGLYGMPPEDEPDLVIMAGLRFGLTTAHGSGALIPRDARVVQIDPSGAELGHLQPVTLSVAADPLPVLQDLNREPVTGRAAGADLVGWRNTLRAHLQRRREAVAAQVVHDERVHPYDAVRAIAAAVPDASVVVADGALTYLWLSETISEAPVSAFLCHGYLGSMGVGMGIALGAQAAVEPGTNVVLVTGDGSVGYSLGEFDSMVRAGLGAVVVVLNNRAWGATLHAQEILLGKDRIVNNRLENGSYAAAAIALGADGYQVRALDELAPALAKALQSGRPSCIEVHVSLDPIPPEERVIMGGSPF